MKRQISSHAIGQKLGAIALIDHEDAKAAAKAQGFDDGVRMATDRISSILHTKGIYGEGSRMAAAMQLAANSPDMAGQAIVSFVMAKVPPDPKRTGGSVMYDRGQRLTASFLALPHGGRSGGAESGLSARVSALRDKSREH